MKAIVYYRCGSPDVLRCEEIEKPAAGDDDVLIQVRAASVNPLDFHAMRGGPSIVRALTGMGGPKRTRLGRDVAGQVEAVGRNVARSVRATRCSAPALGPSPSMRAPPSRRWS